MPHQTFTLNEGDTPQRYDAMDINIPLEKMEDAGYTLYEIPDYDANLKYPDWDEENKQWVLKDHSNFRKLEISAEYLYSQRRIRDKIIQDEVQWRIDRELHLARLGEDPIDDIAVLDKWMKDLRECINVEDPLATVFPDPPAGLSQPRKTSGVV